MSGTWENDWPTRVYERLVERGFHSLTEFIDSRPMSTLLALAQELGPGIAAVQLESLWLREAERGRFVGQMLGSLLCRRIHRALSEGWFAGENFSFQLTRSFVSWASVADEVLPDEERDAVWEAMRTLDPPPGWLPVFPADTWTTQLQEAIDQALARVAAAP